MYQIDNSEKYLTNSTDTTEKLKQLNANVMLTAKKHRQCIFNSSIQDSGKQEKQYQQSNSCHHNDLMTALQLVDWL